MILDFSPLSSERDLNPSNPANAAQDPGQDTGDFQSREAGGKDQDVTKGEALDALPADTLDSLPADPEPEGEDATPAQALDTSPANTADSPPTGPTLEPTAETPTAADSLPSNRDPAPKPEPAAADPAPQANIDHRVQLVS